MHSQTFYTHNHFDSSYPDFGWPGARAGHGVPFAGEWHDGPRHSERSGPDDFVGDRERWASGFRYGPRMRGGPAAFMHGHPHHTFFDAVSRDFPVGPAPTGFPPRMGPAGRMRGPPPFSFHMSGPEGGDIPLDEAFDDKLNLNDESSVKCTCADAEKCECDASKLEKGETGDHANGDVHVASAPRPGGGRGRGGGHFRGGHGRGRGGFVGRGMGHFGPRGPPPFPFDESEGPFDFSTSRGRGRGGHHHHHRRGSAGMLGGPAFPYAGPHGGPSDFQDICNLGEARGFSSSFPQFPFGSRSHWRDGRGGGKKQMPCPTCGCTRRHFEPESDEPIDQEMHDNAEDDAGAQDEAVAEPSTSKTPELEKSD